MIRKLTLKKEREHETNEASIAGNVMRDLIAHVTNDNLIGRKIKSGELRKKMVEPPWKCPDMFTMTTIEMEEYFTVINACPLASLSFLSLLSELVSFALAVRPIY